MKRLLGCLVLVALGAAALPLAPAQEAGDDADGAKIAALVERLGADDYRARDAAYAELAEFGEAARPSLERARNHEDPEIRWRSRRLLRALDRETARRERRDGSGERGGVSPRPGDPGAESDRIRGPWRRIPDRFGDDPFGWLDERREGRGGFGFTGPEERRIRGLIERLRERQRTMLQGLDGWRIRPWGIEPFGIPSPGTGAEGGGEATSFTSLGVTIENEQERIEFRYDPDGGATATVTRKGKDALEGVEEYRADDLDTFRRAHPEISRKLGLDRFSVSLHSGDGETGRFRVAPPHERSVAAPSTPRRLGILCGELPEVVRRHLSLGAGRGILVEEVEQGSLAAELGMAPFDILVRVEDQVIAQPADVAKVLGRLESGDAIRVEVIRAGETMSLEARF